MDDRTNKTGNNWPSKVSRRGFLIAITGSAVAAAAGCRPEGVNAPTPYVPGSGTQAPTFPPSAATRAATAAAAQAATVDQKYGTVTFDKMMQTKTDDLYITQYDYDNTPQVDAKTWSLKIDGLVDNPITLDYNAVKAFPATEQLRTLECISNPVSGSLIGNVTWKGFDFSEILKQVKPKSNATHLKFECADGYSNSLEIKWVKQDNVMMAYEMNGQPLNATHGFPIRILIPGLYGQKMPRWITRMEFIGSYYQGYWESKGWSDVAAVQTASHFETPSDGYSVQAGTTLAFQGIAWAGNRKITKVEIQVDGGEWMPATLLQDKSPLAWTQFYLTWTPTAPATYRIGVRATDENGFVQSNEASGIFGDSYPNGTSAIHRILVTAT